MARWSDLEIETRKEQMCQNCHSTRGAKNEGWRGASGRTHGSTIPQPFPAPRQSLQSGEWEAEPQQADFTS